MTNQFLVGIHDFISGRMDEERRSLAAAQAAGDARRTALLKGKLDQWIEIRIFLSNHFDLLTMKYY
jgi:hypothetical protein